MKVIDIARKLGMNSSKIRYYDKIGLLHSKRNQDNQYRDFDDLDALKIMHMEMLRSFSLNIEETKLACTLEENALNRQLHQQRQLIQLSIQKEQARLKRLEETMDYIKYVSNNKSRISMFQVPQCWMIFSVGINEELTAEDYREIVKLSDAFPFSYVALHIPFQSLQKDHILKMEMGFGILEKYSQLLDTKITTDCYHYTGCNTVQLYIETKNPFKLTQQDIEPLKKYLKQHNYPLNKDLFGRVYLAYQKDDEFYFGITLGYMIN